jgi:hypothetical protein
MVRTADARRSFLQSMTDAYRQGRWPTLEALRTLAGICRDPRCDLRETALTLLLSPPVPQDAVYLRWLLEQLPVLFPSRRDMPVELLEHILESVGFLEAIPATPKADGVMATILRNLPAAGLRWLFARSLPPMPFLRCLLTRSIAWLFGGKSGTSRDARRWRLLQRRLVRSNDQAGWASLSTGDIGKLWPARLRQPAGGSGAGRYRRVARSLVAPVAGVSAVSPPISMVSAGIQYWNGAGSHTLSYLDALIRQQAKELRRVRDLAERVSERTGRVVLSCHNATLAACSGWGMSMVHRQFPDELSWQSLEQATIRVLGGGSAVPVAQDDEVQRFWGLYQGRLVRPKIKQALWESALRALLGGCSGASWEKDFDCAGKFFSPQDLVDIQDGRGSGWTGALSPHQRLRLPKIIAWDEERRASWHTGLFLLATIIAEGQRLLDAGKLRHLVVPWIDKFFISSQRERDLDFFPRILKWLEQQGCRPLVLLWEDTSHAHSPSLQLAMRQLRERGFLCQGIGVFDWGPNPVVREDAEEFIVKQHQGVLFFALRPFSDCHNPKSLPQILKERDHAFLRSAHYDSSWKDNLAFLYAGTQVAPLLSVPGDAESFPGWLVAGSRKVPFGTFFRGRLRQLLFNREDEGRDRENLAGTYALWANLL